MKNITSEHELYAEFIRDLYSAEVQEIPALHSFKNLVSSEQLRTILQRHIRATKMQVLRLEDLIDYQQESLIEEHCRTMKSMIAEARDLAARCEEGTVRDSAILASLKRIKNCEIQVYRMLIQMAGKLKTDSIPEPLEYNLKEELAMLESLSTIYSQQQELV